MIRNTLPASLIDHPRLDQWIAFEPGGTVRLSTGKVEIGQGVLTALAQIAAEELDVAPERLRVRSGETGRTPNEGYTAGSLSIEVSGGSIRLVCADVRARFLDAAAAGLACEAGELSVADGRILRRRPGDRPRLLGARRARRSRPRGARHGRAQASRRLSPRRPQRAAPRPARKGVRRAVHP